MKKSTRFFALCLALTMCLSLAMAGAVGETALPVEATPIPGATAAPEAADPVAVTVNGEPVLVSAIVKIYSELYNQYTSQGYNLSGQESILQSMAVQYAIQDVIFQQKAAEFGADQFTQEEEAGFQADAQAEWDGFIEQNYSYFLTAAADTPTEQEIADAKAKTVEYMNTMAYSLEEAAAYFKNIKIRERLTDYLMKDFVPYTQEEVQTEYEKRVKEDEEAFAQSITAYESASSEGEEGIWYVPEGVRGITHILLNVDDGILDNYLTLKAQLAAQETQADALAEEEIDPVPEEAATVDPSATAAPETSPEPEATADPTLDPAATPEITPVPVTQADVDAARQAVLDSIQDKLTDIYNRLAAGESFAALVEEYGQDPGMQQEPYKTDGYSVHKDFTGFIQEFTDGAFAPELQKVGDYGQPIIGSYGVHILCYVRDVPSGPVALTQERNASLLEEMEQTRKSNALPDAMEEWLAAAQIVFPQAEATQDPAAEPTQEPAETGTEAPVETPVATPAGN